MESRCGGCGGGPNFGFRQGDWKLFVSPTGKRIMSRRWKGSKDLPREEWETLESGRDDERMAALREELKGQPILRRDRGSENWEEYERG